MLKDYELIEMIGGFIRNLKDSKTLEGSDIILTDATKKSNDTLLADFAEFHEGWGYEFYKYKITVEQVKIVPNENDE